MQLPLPQIGQDTIRARLLRLVLLLLVPSLSLAAMVTWRSLQADRSAVEANLRGHLFSLGVLVDGLAARAEVPLRLLAASDAARQGDLAQLSRMAQAAAPLAGRIVITNAAGQVLADTGPAPAPPVPWLAQAGTHAAMHWTRDAGGAPELLLSLPVPMAAAVAAPAPSPSARALELTAVLKLSDLRAAVAAVDLPAGWIAKIYDQAQRVVAQSHVHGAPGMEPAVAPIAAALAAGRFAQGLGTTEDGEAMRFAAGPSPEFHIPLAVVAPLDFIAQPSRLSLILLFTEGTALVVLGLFAARRVARSITAPIEALALVTGRMGDAEALPLVPTGGLAEAQQVGQAIQAAHVTLLERRAALSELNATLAARVAARTAELATANAALQEQRTQLGLILDHMPIGVLVNGPGGYVIYANIEARNLIGTGAGEFDQRNIPIILHNGQPMSLEDAPPARARRGIVTVREQVTIVRRDGVRLELEVSAGPVFDSAGEIALSVTTLAEISARLEAEESRRRSQRLEAVGQLTGGVAHEFNNLLMAIGGCIDLLRPIVPGDRGQTLLENAARAADHGARLTRQLLAFARRQNLQPEPLDLNALVAGMQDLLTSTLGRSIDVVVELDSQAWPALADPTQLELVLLNLAINARDAMPQGGRLLIGTGNASCGAPGRAEEPPAGEYAMLRVSDTGIGMSQDIQARIFEPFFTTKDVGRGTGLGLPQVLGVVQQLGGGVSVHSQPGEGTVVRVYLPRARTPAATIRNPHGRPAVQTVQAALPLKDLAVLLVDDDTEVRAVTRAMLEDCGALVGEAASGAEALLQLRTAPGFDVILADYTMPEMTGLELAARVQALDCAVPVVLMTGYSAATLGNGAPHIKAVLQKPFRAEQLIATLRQASLPHPAHQDFPS